MAAPTSSRSGILKERQVCAYDRHRSTLTFKRSTVFLFLAIVAVLVLMSSALISYAHATANKPIRWLFAGPEVIKAITADVEASRFLDNTKPFIIGRQFTSDIPPSWDAVQLVSLKSLSAIRKQIPNLGPEVRSVMYDYERWRFTPQQEQRNPARFVKQAADLVHAHGLLFLTAPAVDLVKAIEPMARPEQMDKAYLRLRIAADAARHADVFDIQAQRFESDTKRYANFVRLAAAQARQANPKVSVLAGISTQPFGPRVTADDIVAAIMATRDVVDGYWFNIPRPSQFSPHVAQFRPDIALEVLHRLATTFGDPGSTAIFNFPDVSTAADSPSVEAFFASSSTSNVIFRTASPSSITPVSAPSEIPLPPAIYLFGSILGGAFWLGRRKRNAVSSLG
jgi:hypothetical protein